jgi:hypothetical protein
MPTISKWFKLIVACAVLALVCLPLAVASTGCANVKPVLQTADDIAQTLCAKYHQESFGISIEDAAKKYCELREDYAPWIDAALASIQAGAAAKAGAAKCAEPAATVAPAPVVPEPAPAPSVAPVPATSATTGQSG